MWSTHANWSDNKHRVDHSLFDTLAKLASLSYVTLLIENGELRKRRVIDVIRFHKPPRSLEIRFKRGSWTAKDRDGVQEKADRAGVTFLYCILR